MINELKDDHIIRKIGGRFKLTALMQKRWIELMQGSRPLIEPGERGELEVIAEEIMSEKIEAVPGEPMVLTPDTGSSDEQD
jgi:DNA-directed RNA polymerase subunit omega